jgi:hypothetical protein
VHKLISALVLIYASQAAFAGGNSDLYDSGGSASREITRVTDVLPDMEDLGKAPRCEGNEQLNNTCGQFQTRDGCLNEGADQGCFWAYD